MGKKKLPKLPKPQKRSASKKLYLKLHRSFLATLYLCGKAQIAMRSLGRMLADQKTDQYPDNWQEIAKTIQDVQLSLDEIADMAEDIRTELAVIEIDFKPKSNKPQQEGAQEQ